MIFIILHSIIPMVRFQPLTGCSETWLCFCCFDACKELTQRCCSGHPPPANTQHPRGMPNRAQIVPLHQARATSADKVTAGRQALPPSPQQTAPSAHLSPARTVSKRSSWPPSSQTHSSQHLLCIFTLRGWGQSGDGRRRSAEHSGMQPMAPSRQMHCSLQVGWKLSPLWYTLPRRSHVAPSRAEEGGEGGVGAAVMLLGPVLHRALLLAVLKETERQRPPKNSCFPTGLQLGYNREIRH